jgi:hypothetical protein
LIVFTIKRYNTGIKNRFSVKKNVPVVKKPFLSSYKSLVWSTGTGSVADPDDLHWVYSAPKKGGNQNNLSNPYGTGTFFSGTKAGEGDNARLFVFILSERRITYFCRGGGEMVD